jgi:hypothetical protein
MPDDYGEDEPLLPRAGHLSLTAPSSWNATARLRPRQQLCSPGAEAVVSCMLFTERIAP